MNEFDIQNFKRYCTIFMRFLSHAFDKTATWVSKLSWWKFFIFAILLIISGDLIQTTFFNSNEKITQQAASTRSKPQSSQTKSRKNDSKLEVDNSGIRLRKSTDNSDSKSFEIDGDGIRIIDEKNKSTEEEKKIPTPLNSGDNTEIDIPKIIIGGKEVHIQLPKDIAREIRAEIDNEIANAANNAAKAENKKKSSTWFANFILLLVFGLFGMKALMGGKVRAEEKAKQAQAVAEKESLLRQVSEAQMQMMQAQVEPHFLFNTLASVEYLIETDPPRAAAMQRSLIAYLRAVLPKIRDKAPKTNLGREADMVKAYLELLKMRMEERLTIDFLVPDSLRNASFPPMMLQSLVENAIKHGLEVKAEGGTLTFRAEKINDKLRVSVRDDGLGFGAVPSNGTGLGLQNIRERLQLIYNNQAKIIITPNQPSGVCVMIEIPYEIAD